MTATLDRPLTAAELFTGEIHPFAERFPTLSDEELDDLAEDIAANGQLHPIMLDSSGVLLDGRNRLEACDRADVPPIFAVYEGNPLALILSANVKRRQMTAGQSAMATAIGLAEQGLRKGGRWARDALSEQSSVIAGTSNESAKVYLKRAGAILDYDQDRGTDFAGDVLTGSLPLSEAHKAVMRARRGEQDATDAADYRARELDEAAAKAREVAERMATEARVKGDRLRAEAPDLAALVTAEKLPMDEAIAALDARNQQVAAARISDLNQWSRLCSDIDASLSAVRDRTRAPSDMTENYPPLSTAIDRATELVARLEGMRDE